MHRTHFDFMRFYFLYYIMITKFRGIGNSDHTIEFERSESSNVDITIEDCSNSDFQLITLSEKDLFSLIGQLLRIQSEIRKEFGND